MALLHVKDNLLAITGQDVAKVLSDCSAGNAHNTDELYNCASEYCAAITIDKHTTKVKHLMWSQWSVSIEDVLMVCTA